jgi:hypothetical protein
VSQVPGVIEVDGLELFIPLSAGGYQQLPTDASGKSTLTLDTWQLPEVLAVVVAAGPDGNQVDVPPLTAPVESDPTVAVPIVPTVC